MARTAKTKTGDHSVTEPAETTQEQTIVHEAASSTPRPGSKLAVVLNLLESDAGATIAEIMAATKWQQHTVRGALVGSITKKFGRLISSDMVDGRDRVYRAESPTG